MISYLAQSLARDSVIHNSRPRPSSARSARTRHGYFESTEAGSSASKLLKRARYAPQLLTPPKLPAAAEGVVPRAPESLWVTFPAACGVSPGHDQRLRQEARPGLPEAPREPPVGSLLKYPAACGGDPLSAGHVGDGEISLIFKQLPTEKPSPISKR